MKGGYRFDCGLCGGEHTTLESVMACRERHRVRDVAAQREKLRFAAQRHRQQGVAVSNQANTHCSSCERLLLRRTGYLHLWRGHALSCPRWGEAPNTTIAALRRHDRKERR